MKRDADVVDLDSVRPLAAQEFDQIRQLAYRTFGLDLKTGKIAAKNQTFFEVKDAYYRFQSAAKIADLYAAAIIPQAKLALSADQAGYEGSKAGFLDLLDSERVYLNAKLSGIQFQAETLKAYADLLWATGLDLQEMEGQRK